MGALILWIGLLFLYRLVSPLVERVAEAFQNNSQEGDGLASADRLARLLVGTKQLNKNKMFPTLALPKGCKTGNRKLFVKTTKNIKIISFPH